MERHQIRRTLSEPFKNDQLKSTSSIFKIESSSISRERQRSTIISFEQGRDQVAVWMNEWTTGEIRSVLLGLIQRCSLHQMSFLWTTLESVPHKDFLYQAAKKYPSYKFQPLSTPISRDVKTRLQRSRYPENKSLFRTQSILITHSSSPSLLACPVPKTTSLTTLPGLRPPTDPLQTPLEEMPEDSIRLCSPTRRHMSFSLSKPGTPSCYHLPTVLTDAWSSVSGQSHHHKHRKRSLTCDKKSLLPPNGMLFLVWFTTLERDWQQQEVLQLVIWSLNQKELYYLAILLLSRQYKDFVGDLTLSLSLRILSNVSGKDILLACQVSKQWYDRCSDENLWRIKCGQINLGLPPVIQTTWRQLFIDDIKLKRNWRLGRAKSLSLTKHTGRVLCVAVNEKEELCATGSCDHTIKLWRLKDGKLLTIINETARVWSLCFYGLNLLISGSSEGVVKIWNTRTTRLLKTLEGHTGTIWALRQKRDTLVTGSHDKTAILWNVRQCRYTRHLIGHKGVVFGVDLNEDTSVAFSCSGDKTIRVWDTASGECVKVIPSANGHSVLSLCYSKIAYSSGSNVYLWSLKDNRMIFKFKGHENRVEGVHLQRDGSNPNTIVSCGRDGFVKYWNTESGHCIRTMGPLSSRINSIDRDSTRIVVVSDDNSLTIFDFSPLSELGDTPPTSRPISSTPVKSRTLTSHAYQQSEMKSHRPTLAITFDKLNLSY